MPAIDKTINSFAQRLAAHGVAIRIENNMSGVDELESQLSISFPRSYRLLLRRYSFPAFEIAGVELAGTDDANFNVFRLFSKDLALQEGLLSAGLIQIGRPETGSYDPICFNTRCKRQNREYPVVRVDHEEILCNNRIGRLEPVWPSFYGVITNYLIR